MSFKILVCGGRDYGNSMSAKTDDRLEEARQERFKIYTALAALNDRRQITELVHGGALGADSAAASWASLKLMKVHKHPARWHDLDHPEAVIKTHPSGLKYNANAVPIRNREMLDAHPDIELVVAFPGGTGTAKMKEQAKQRGIKVQEYG